MLAPLDNFLRCINFILLVISIALISALLNTQRGNSSRVNFCMFAAAFGIATDGLYGLLANVFEVLAFPVVLFVLDFLNFVFTFTAGTTLAVGIRAHSCKNNRYVNSNHITQGSENRCREAQAAVAFFYFSMAIFLAKAIFSLVNMVTNGPFDTGLGFGTRRRRREASKGIALGGGGSGPNMSQV